MTDQEFMIEAHQKVASLMPTESMSITKIQAFGLKCSLSPMGVNTESVSSNIGMIPYKFVRQ